MATPAFRILVVRTLTFVSLLTPALAVGGTPSEAQEGTAMLVGRITDDGGAPARNLEVHAVRDGRAVAADVTDADGRFQIRVVPGTHTVRVPRGLGIRGTESEPVEAISGSSVHVELVVARQIYPIEGVVVTGTALPDGREQGSVGGYIGVVEGREVQRNVSVNPTDALRAQAGTDLVDTGLGSRVIAFRGFNNVFGGSVRYLVDFRKASIPSLRANFMHFVPTATPDVDRMEMVLGPSSAIYGPNSANGVLNVLTRSPLRDDSQTWLSLGGGTQSVFQSEARTSQRLGDRLALKVSARWFQGQEFDYVDPAEVAVLGDLSADPGGFADRLRDLGVPEGQIPLRMGRIGIRDTDIERWSVDGRLDWEVFRGDTAVIQAGRTNTTGLEVTPLGAAQAGDWKYDYVQARYHSGAFFAQAFLNRSDAGDSYLLRDGAPLVDESQLVGLQARHGFTLFGGAEEITYGADWARTTPRTGGTIHGQFEDEDVITEYGGYVQSRTRIADGLHLIGTVRLDDSNVIEDPVLSPRAGVVWQPAPGHTLSGSWSRGFSTPTPTNYFLDISGGTAAPPLGALGYRLRARGTGRAGIRFSDVDGGYQGMRSPCTPQAAGGPSTLVPASATNVWQCVVGVMAAQGAIDPQTAAFLASLDPAGAVSLNALDPVKGTLTPLVPGAIADVEPLRENTTTTMELGYRGLIGQRLFLQAAVWRTRLENLSSPLLLRTPLLTLNGGELAAFLAARGLPAEQAGALAAGAAGIPGGVLSSSDIRAQGAELVATYENFGEITYHGVDLGARLQLNRVFTVNATASWMSDDHFVVEGRVVPLNSPDFKGNLSLAFADLPVPVVGEVGLRHHNGFPVASGEYVGLECLGESGPLVEACVSGATLLDATIGYEGLFGSDLALRVSVRNILDEEYRPFVGVPSTGRQIMARLEYRLR
ncbi:MAG TPA: TonB-dependent receptor [Longimicrobiales bacterium]|nr:TonB-dependent receptor [Longimicrobiales bacterium]